MSVLSVCAADLPGGLRQALQSVHSGSAPLQPQEAHHEAQHRLYVEPVNSGVALSAAAFTQLKIKIHFSEPHITCCEDVFRAEPKPQTNNQTMYPLSIR